MARKTYKKVIVTPELLEQVNPKNIELRDLFLKEKNARSSDKTIISYLSDLNIFFKGYSSSKNLRVNYPRP